jgi:hypothetical protein
MTGQAMQRACHAVEEYVQAEPSLKLDVMRGGFMLRGLDELLSPPGAEDLADALGSHGIGEIHFVAPPQAEELLALYQATLLPPHDLAEQGGMQTALAQAGVESVRVVPLVLSKIEQPPEIPEDEADKFLAELAADAGRLAVWLRSLLASDDEGLVEGIQVLASAAGDVDAFGRTMAAAFLELESDETDRLLEASVTLEGVRDVTQAMLGNLSDTELTAAIRGGRYGENLVGLSYILTELPLGARRDTFARETVHALSAADMPEPQIAFLVQLVAIRRDARAEQPLGEEHPEYAAIARATCLTQEHIDTLGAHVDSRRDLDSAGVSTLFFILDTADELGEYASVLGAIGRAVPHLMGIGSEDLAMHVLREISRLSTTVERPWPNLASAFDAAMRDACDARSMSALLSSDEREKAIEYAREIVTLGGDTAASGLAAAALDSELEDSMEFAFAVLGRRLPELLAPDAARAEAHHAAKMAELFAADGSPACMQALTELTVRSEEQVRAKTARGIAVGGGRAVGMLMPALLRDSSSGVAMVAVRSLTEHSGDEGVRLLAERLGELGDEADVPLARDIIASLAASTLPVAQEALEQAASKGGLFGKGRHPDIRKMAHDTLELRRERGGA